MALELNGTTGVSLVQDGVVTAADLAFTPGKVLQVVQATYGTETSTTSSTYADTGLSASITPTSATSKILVLVHHPGNRKLSTSSSTRGGLRLLRGSTVLQYIDTLLGYNNVEQNNAVGAATCAYLDSPATTSSTTYKTQFALDNSTGGGAFYIFNFGTQSVLGSITLMEIAA